MKKILLILALMFLQITACQAAVQMKVVALEGFKTDAPTETIKVKVLQDYTLGEYDIAVNSILNCKILLVVDPKRGKRNATFYVRPLSYTVNGATCTIEDEFYGKYSKFVLSKEEIKEIPAGTVVKKAALSVGNFFVKGFSTGVAFVQGFAQNEKHNRFKSGVANAYEQSILSYISEGKQLDINVGDDFYLVFKTKEDAIEEAKADDAKAVSNDTEDETQSSNSEEHINSSEETKTNLTDEDSSVQ